MSVILSAAFVAPTVVGADPIQVTGGQINLYWDSSSSGFQLLGSGFNIAVVDGMHAGLGIPTVQVGVPQAFEFDVIPAGFGTASVPGFSTGSGEFVDLRGSLHFVTPTMTFADPTALFGSFSMPFTMTGTVSGFERGAAEAMPLFTASVFGSGTTTVADLRRFEQDGGPVYMAAQSGVQSIAFSDQTPVPEPGTVLLFASGAAALAARRKRRDSR